jgi:cell division inhibitor SepF
MSGILKKGISWLGFGPEEDYDDYEEYEDEYVDLSAPAPAPVASSPTVRAVPSMPAREDPEWEEEAVAVRVLPQQANPRPRVVPNTNDGRRTSVVRPLPAGVTAKPQVISPKSFNDAQQVGDLFRKRQPVIVNLQKLDRDLARRLLDFASGVAYGLGGAVERVASHVYLLTPSDVEVSADDRRRIVERGLVDD